MTIIEHGCFFNKYLFICENCGCKWYADLDEIRITGIAGEVTVPRCYCPECNHYTEGEEREI